MVSRAKNVVNFNDFKGRVKSKIGLTKDAKRSSVSSLLDGMDLHDQAVMLERRIIAEENAISIQQFDLEKKKRQLLKYKASAVRELVISAKQGNVGAIKALKDHYEDVYKQLQIERDE